MKRKFPTSAWRRSTSSTRRTRERFGAWYRKPEAAAAAEAAELAGELSAWELPAEAAADRGELAACARADRFPIALTNAGPYGRVRQKRPGQSMSCLQRCPWVAKPLRIGYAALPSALVAFRQGRRPWRGTKHRDGAALFRHQMSLRSLTFSSRVSSHASPAPSIAGR